MRRTLTASAYTFESMNRQKRAIAARLPDPVPPMISRTTVSTVSVQMRICSRIEARSVPVEQGQGKAAVCGQIDLSRNWRGQSSAVVHQGRRREQSRHDHHENRDQYDGIEEKGPEA